MWDVHTNGNVFPALTVWDVHKNGNVFLGLTVCDVHTNGNVFLGFTVWDVHTYGNDWVSMPRPIAHGTSLGPRRAYPRRFLGRVGRTPLSPTLTWRRFQMSSRKGVKNHLYSTDAYQCIQHQATPLSYPSTTPKKNFLLLIRADGNWTWKAMPSSMLRRFIQVI